MQLGPSTGPQVELEELFEELKATVEKPKPRAEGEEGERMDLGRHLVVD